MRVQVRLCRVGLVAMAVAAAGCSSSGGSPARSGDLELRPLLAPATAVDAAAGGNADLAALGFDVPSNDAGYAGLTEPQRARLTHALAAADCAHPRTGASYRVVCDAAGKTAYLTGPIILGQAEVATAVAEAPDLHANSVEWSVSVTLTATGGAEWASYTRAHNTGPSGVTVAAKSCGPSTAPCADFVAFIVSGRAITVPVNVAAITGGRVQITGSLTKSSAEALARKITGG